MNACSIPLTQGKVAIVDADDFDWLNQWKWCASEQHNRWYAHQGCNGNAMHRVILNAPCGIDVDHIDNDGLNNRRNNLRLATKQQNACNAKIRKDNVTGYKGVSFNKSRNKFQAKIVVNGKHIYLGLFDDKIYAAKIYNEAAVVFHGAFARLNKID